MLIFSTIRKGDQFKERSVYYEEYAERILASSYVAENLKLPKNSINLKFRKFRGKRTFGQCSMFKYKSGTTYLIELDVRVELREFVYTLLHELKHVEQGHLKKLKCVKDNTLSWKKDIYDADRLTTEYKTLPWEVEADAFATAALPHVLKEIYKRQ